jgi:hypothetical protein
MLAGNMRSTTAKFVITLLIGACATACAADASSPSRVSDAELAAAFVGAQRVDLRTSKASSVVTLREVVKLPPPAAPVLVKTFRRESIPVVLKPVFANSGIMGVTMNSRFIAILHTEFPKEHEDILRHELVHAYISMISPKPLPFWFQEASAVHFSTDKGRKFYGKPAEEVGRMVGKTVDLTDTYKQKLQSFHFLIEQAGKEKFYEWYREAVLTGDVDARLLLGLKPAIETQPRRFRKPFPLWLGLAIAGVVVVVTIIGFYAAKMERQQI